MGAITDLSQLVNILTGGSGAKETLFVFNDDRMDLAAGQAAVPGQYSSMWLFNRAPGGCGLAPGSTARIPTRATQGALGQTNPTGGRQKFLTGLSGVASLTGLTTLYDRLADISGLSGTSASVQPISGLVPTRYTGTASAGNQIWIEIYTLIGATATTITASYTNQDGTPGRTTKPALIGNTNRREPTRIIVLPLQNGDTGVRSVESVTLAATTGTTGDFGVTIARPLAAFSCTGNLGAVTDLLSQFPSMPEILNDACLAQKFFSGAAAIPRILSNLSMVEA